MKVLYSVCCVLILLAGKPVLAEDIVWAVTELEGVIDLDTHADPPRLTGFVGELQTYLLQHLPERYRITPVPMSVPRMLRELQAHDNVCTGILYSTPQRGAFVHFSRNYMAVPTPQAVMTEAAWQRLGQPERLLLATVVSHPQLRGLKVSNRSYGAYIDNQLDQANNLAPTVNSSANAMRMLAGGRADYLIEYPAVIEQTLGEDADQLHFIELEGFPAFLGIPIACSQSDLGAAFIAEVDARLRSLVSEPTYQAYNLEVAPRALRPGLADAYRRLVLDSSQP